MLVRLFYKDKIIGFIMSGKDSPQNVIKKFENRQKMMPYFLGGLAGVLVILGIFIIVTVVSGQKKPFSGLFSTKTPTATVTSTPTATQPSPTPSMTPTETLTPTPEASATPSKPFQYVVKEGDDCWTIAYNNNADLLYMQQINLFTDPANTCPISPGDTIWIPAPGQKMPTPTRVPDDVARGTTYEYTIQSGDTLATIASYFNSTVDDILLHNKIKDQNAINVGDKINVRANIATPTPTLRATSTLANQTPGLPTPSVTATPK
jgi:LysM repeat protein